MKRRILTSIGFIVAGLLIGLGVGYQLGCTAMANCINNYNRSNDTTRDINYEHYCDSIYEVNPDYYLDVLVETDKYQNYIKEHGEWWTN